MLIVLLRKFLYIKGSIIAHNDLYHQFLIIPYSVRVVLSG